MRDLWLDYRVESRPRGKCLSPGHCSARLEVRLGFVALKRFPWVGDMGGLHVIFRLFRSCLEYGQLPAIKLAFP